MEEQFDFRYLTQKQWQKLSSIEKPIRDHLILELLYQTGCTVNELVNIRPDDVDWRRNTIHIRPENSRNGESRDVFVGKMLIADMKASLKKTKRKEYVLSSRQSPSLTTKRVCQIVKSYCKKIGLGKASPQILRYTHIVHAYEKDVPIDAIQKQVGLKRSRAIEIFSQLRLKDKRNAYEGFVR